MHWIFYVIVILILGYPHISNAQVETALIINTLDKNEYVEHRKKKPLMDLSQKSLVAKLNPLTYLVSATLFIYQNLVSEQIMANCVYEVSCSENFKQQIAHNGMKGFLLGLYQFNNCSERVIDDYPAHKINSKGKIINSIE